MATLSQLQGLILYLTKGLGSATLSAIESKIDLVELFDLPFDELIALSIKPTIAEQIANPDLKRIEQLQKSCGQQNIQIIHTEHEAYPKLLKQTCHAPLILFCKGNIELLNEPQIAIVGSRNATPPGLECASEFAYQLTRSGITVTSGMAMGIDGAAHKGALAGNGNTIAVLGTGVDVAYPKRHNYLYQQLVDQGLVISEFLPGAVANQHNFPRRNRIISGLSLGTLIVEAEIKSGSLITAKYALEQNREVFAIPGSIRNPLAAGCHHLIKQGAKLVESVTDILEDVSFLPNNGLYNIERAENAPIEDSEENCPILKSLGFEAASVDVITHSTQWPVEKVLARLLDLELEDKVARTADGYIKLARG